MSPSRIWRQLSVWIRIRARGRSDHTVKLTEICMHQLVLSNTKLQSIAVCLAHTGRSCKCDTELCKTNVPSNRSSQRSHLQHWSIVYYWYCRWNWSLSMSRGELRVAVIGAGVIGLSSAVRIAQEIEGANVTVFADKFDDETTSSGAAGLWEPYKLSDTPAHLVRRWGRDTFEFLQVLTVSNDTHYTMLPQV